MNQCDLQIQIGEYLSNLMMQMDQKINHLAEHLNSLETKLDNVIQHINTIETNYHNNYKNSYNTFDTDAKRKISMARYERDLERLLEREKANWEREYLEQEKVLELAREKWELEAEKRKIKMNDMNFSYLS
jgi:hypothetical protein